MLPNTSWSGYASDEKKNHVFALTEKEDLCQGYSVEKAAKFAAGHRQTVSEENGSMCPLLNYLQLLHFDVKLFDFSDFLQLLIRSAFHLTLSPFGSQFFSELAIKCVCCRWQILVLCLLWSINLFGFFYSTAFVNLLLFHILVTNILETAKSSFIFSLDHMMKKLIHVIVVSLDPAVLVRVIIMFNFPKDTFWVYKYLPWQDAIKVLYLQISETCGLLWVLPFHSLRVLV